MTQKGPTMNQTVEQIARRLSRTQIRVLLGLSVRGDILRTLRALERRGLMHGGVIAHPTKGGFHHTTLGLAVRNFIQDQGS